MCSFCRLEIDIDDNIKENIDKESCKLQSYTTVRLHYFLEHPATPIPLSVKTDLKVW